MYIFNSTINTFIKKQKERMVKILKESNLIQYKVNNLYVSDTKEFLGQYDFNKSAIILNKSLMTMKQETIDLVLKHELAHHCSMTRYGSSIKSHGKEFKEFCLILDVSPKAKVDIKKIDDENKTSLKEEAILIKVKKLLALSNSTNENEAQIAIEKANELLTKHNLQYIKEDYQDIYQSTIYMGKQANSKWSSIAKLLSELFDVYPVWNSTRMGTSLEINGTKESVEIAEYVSEYLDRELENLYKEAKKKYSLKGRSEKLNYFRSLINTYINNIKSHQKEILQPESQKEVIEASSVESKEIITLSKTLAEKKASFYKEINKQVYNNKIKTTKTKLSRKANAQQAGRKDSNKLSIRKGVGKNNPQKLLN